MIKLAGRNFFRTEFKSGHHPFCRRFGSLICPVAEDLGQHRSLFQLVPDGRKKIDAAAQVQRVFHLATGAPHVGQGQPHLPGIHRSSQPGVPGHITSTRQRGGFQIRNPAGQDQSCPSWAIIQVCMAEKACPESQTDSTSW